MENLGMKLKTNLPNILVGLTCVASVAMLVAAFISYRVRMDASSSIADEFIKILVQITYVPHMIMCAVGIMLIVCGWFFSDKALVLSAALMFTVATAIMTNRFYFGIAQTVLCYATYANICFSKRKGKNEKE